jgi:stringent starvation protein B
MAEQPEQHNHPSTKPYLLRAIYEWCTDNGFTPYLAVLVDGSTRVPMEFVKEGQIVLNISFEATNGLKMGNEYVEFAARFGGVQREIIVPINRVAAIYARENGHGQGFEVTDSVAAEPAPEAAPAEGAAAPATPERPPPGGKPRLTVVK